MISEDWLKIKKENREVELFCISILIMYIITWKYWNGLGRILMKTHSIILSTDMVEAILAGRKNKLWELFSPRPAFNAELDHVDDLVYAVFTNGQICRSRYFAGDIIGVREIFGYDSEKRRIFKAGSSSQVTKDNKWYPAAMMRSDWARLRLKILSCQVIRFRDMSNTDAFAEGYCHLNDWKSAVFRKAATAWACNEYAWEYSFCLENC